MFGDLIDSASPVLGAVTAVAALVFFIVAHEAGHYFAAKATGMKVTEFFLGFGPRIWSFKRGETEYGIKPIPLGAYVKVVGMSSMEEVPAEDEHRTYRQSPFWQKSLVVLAGVAANFLLAFLIFFGIALVEGRAVPSTTVAEVVEDTAASAAGLQPGDVIVAVDGVDTPAWEDVAAELSSRPGEEITLTVERAGEQQTLETTLGQREDPETGETVGFLGVAPESVREPIGVIEGLGMAGSQVVRGVQFTFVAFGRLLQLDTIAQLVGGVFGGEVSNEVRPVSPIGIAQIGSQASEFGVANFVFLLGILNVILGTLNALPLYPLDGGHFAVAVYERITGRQADLRALIPLAVMVIGLISLIGILAIILDIVNPIDL